MCNLPSGSKLGTILGFVPKRIAMRVCSASIRPAPATTRASIGACRSGRNTRNMRDDAEGNGGGDAECHGQERWDVVTDVHTVVDPDDREDQVAGPAELVVDERPPRRHRTAGEVDDAGALVDDDEAAGQRGVHRPERQADDAEDEVRTHCADADLT